MSRPSIRPQRWQPPTKSPETRAKRRALSGLQLIEVPGVGPEDVVVEADGSLITGLADGRILRLREHGKYIETLAQTQGRPLGIELMGDGALLVCDAKRGLLRVAADTGEIELLAESAQGERLGFCNNAAIAADGTIYFSDSSRRFGIEHWRADVLEHSASGRLLRRTPNGTIELLVDGLKFANGVALSADESFVTVAETAGYRLTRYWLKGPKAGTKDLLIENLHGFPDNIARGSDGLIWITQASPRDPLLDLLLPRAPLLRSLVWKLPEVVVQPKRTVWVIAVDAAGQVVHDIQGSHAGYHMVTGVREHAGVVYLGSLVERAIGWFRV
ncbi:MAG: SMP-30/gluconolactonase/LRE family protein [Myxococcales bacterium]